MSRIRIKYVHGYLDRHGRSRHYFRRPGIKRIALPGLPGSPEFNAAYETALAGNAVPRMQVGSNRTIPGNVNAVIVGYYSSTEFSNLKEGTRRERRRILEKFRCEHGNKGTAGIQSHHIEAMVAAKLSTPAEALNFLKAIRALLDYAVKAKMRSDNPAKNVTKPKLGGSFYTWSEHDIAKFEKNFPIGTKARLAFGLLLYTPQRRGDVIRMGRQHIRNTQQGAVIYVRQEKTGAELLIQIHPELQKIIDACPPARLTFLANEKNGKPMTEGSFGRWFKACCRVAGLPEQASAHGVRKAAARRLAEAGCSANVIAAITGHRSLREITRYTEAADQECLARDGIRALTRTAGEQLVANLDNRLAKSDQKPK